MIIGLTGFKRVGKTTVSKYLEDKYGYIRVNFKDGLIAEIKQNFPDLLNEIIDICGAVGADYTLEELFVEKPSLMRALMVNYGTEVRRREDPDYWVLQWKMKVADMMLQGHRNIVTDDLRFLNELQAVKAWNGTTIRIVRDDIPTGGMHPSETELIGVETDHVIHSKQGDLEGLYRAVDGILKV